MDRIRQGIDNVPAAPNGSGESSLTASPGADRAARTGHEHHLDDYYEVGHAPDLKTFRSMKDAVGQVDPAPGQKIPVSHHTQHNVKDSVNEGLANAFITGLAAMLPATIAGVVTSAMFGAGAVAAAVGGILGLPILAVGIYTGVSNYVKGREDSEGHLVNKPFTHPDGTTHNHLTWIHVFGCSEGETIIRDLTATAEKNKESSAGIDAK
jgi:hypothetical protein